MSVLEEFHRAGLGIAEGELAALAARALADIAPRYQSAPGDRHVQKTLADAGFDMSPPAPGELAHLVAGEVMAYTSVLASSLTVQQAAKRLTVDASRVRQRVAARTLYGIRIGREWRLPPWQFDGKGVVPGLAPLLAALDPELDPVSVARFANSANEELLIAGEPVSPLRWLAAGRDVEAVVAIASHLTLS
ncbi:MAG: DNA-binding protein [Acidimicrobiales bacterium]